MNRILEIEGNLKFILSITIYPTFIQFVPQHHPALGSWHHPDRTSIWGWTTAAAAAAKSLQSCLTLCDPIDGSPPGSPIPGILQARTLEWVAISFSNAWKWKVKVKSLCRARLLATPWTAAFQAPPSMWFSRQGQLQIILNRNWIFWTQVCLSFSDAALPAKI